VDRRAAVAEDLRALADDLKSLYESATTDPKERRRKELQWNALQAALGVLTTVVARRLVVKLWGILTGEQAPQRPPTERRRPEPRQETTPQPPVETPPDPLTQVMSQPEAETMSSSSSSVK
jgi:hypothetical protein